MTTTAPAEPQIPVAREPEDLTAFLAKMRLEWLANYGRRHPGLYRVNWPLRGGETTVQRVQLTAIENPPLTDHATLPSSAPRG